MNSSLSSPGEESKLGLLDQIRQLTRLRRSSLHPMIRTNVVIASVIGVLLTAGAARAQVNLEQIVAQKVQPILPENGKGAGVAVAVRMNGTTSFFNYGFANNAQNRRVTEDSIFNLGSVGKVFATTLLAQAVKQGELSLDDRSPNTLPSYNEAMISAG